MSREGGLKRSIIVGIVGGIVTVVACFVVLLVLGLIPSKPLGDALQTDTGSSAARLESAALRAWSLDRLTTWDTAAGAWREQRTGLAFVPLLLGAAATFAVGAVARRLIEREATQRAVLLIAFSLTCAFVVAVVSAAAGFTTKGTYGGAQGVVAEIGHEPIVYFVTATLVSLSLGAFAFGVVGYLPRPLGSAVNRAGLLTGAAFLLAGLLFPVFVITGPVSGTDAQVALDLAHASGYSAAAGGSVVPFALGARVWMGSASDSPFLPVSSSVANYATGAGDARWLGLNEQLVRNAADRMWVMVRPYGRDGWWVAFLLSCLALGGLAWASVSLCRAEGAHAPSAGLGLGIVQGVVVLAFLFIVSYLSRLVVDTTKQGPRAQSVVSREVWGLRADGYARVVVLTFAVCACCGVLYGLVAAVVRRRSPAARAEDDLERGAEADTRERAREDSLREGSTEVVDIPHPNALTRGKLGG